MSPPYAEPSPAPAQERQIFLAATRRRARLINTCLMGVGAATLIAAVVVAIGVLWAPHLTAPEAPPPDPAGIADPAKSPLPAAPEPASSLASYWPRPSGANESVRRGMSLAFAGTEEGDFLAIAEHARDLDGIIVPWVSLSHGRDGPVLRVFREQDELIKKIRAGGGGISVFAQVEADMGTRDLLAVLGDADLRSAVADSLAAYLGSHDELAGLVLDSEVPDSACADMVALLTELRDGQRERGRKVLAVVSPYASSACLRAVSDAVDYVIGATHDEIAQRGSPGAPASQGWFEQSLQRLASSVPLSKLVVGVGAFAIDVNWTGDWSRIPVQRAWDLLKREGAHLAFDPVALDPSFVYAAADGGQHRVWLLDAATAFNQVRTAMAMPLAGVAVWRLGLEDPGVWDIVGRVRKPEHQILRELELISPGYGNFRFLDGVLLAAGPDARGRRALVYDEILGLIVDEHVVSPPVRGEFAIWRAKHPRTVALTFDDGPDPQFTGRILDVLKAKKVHATFYLIGRNIVNYSELVRRIYAEGHDIGNHTFSHPDAFATGDLRLEMELNATQRVLGAVIGVHTNLFRPPYAAPRPGFMDTRPRLIQTASRLGYVIAGMDVDSCDFCGMGTDWIVRNVLNGIVREGRRIVLMHDGGGDRETTVEALSRMIDETRAAGFEFVTTHELVGLPREALMRPWHPLAGLADAQTQVWRRLIGAAGWIGERWPALMIGTALFGMARLALIAVLAIFQFLASVRGRGRRSSAYRGSIDVLVPAYNEEKVVCRTVESILAGRGVVPNVLVVDDGSEDRTSEVLRERFAHEPRLTVLRKENGGKAAALNYGLSLSSAELIVAIDGDTILLADTIDLLTAPFSDPMVGAVAGSVVVGNALNLMTRFQALEYVTSQNLDRRAFELFNAIGVVPGAVGAWRRRAVIQAGGYARDTLAEDADLTFAVQMRGWRVLNEPRAVAMTEAPETLRAFMKQRFRWMFGTLQVTCKNAGELLRRPKGLTFIALPNVFIFQMLFTLLAPVVDAFLLWTALGGLLFGMPDQAATIALIAKYWLVFQTAECMAAMIAISLSGDAGRYWRLVPLLVLQRFTYRQLLYLTAIRSLLAAVKGTLVGWGKLMRTGNVKQVSAPVGS